MREGPAILERMFEALRLQDTPIAPALLLAPMAGVTNAPFRRLLSDFGGYGALTTEMLSATAFLQEDVWASPFTKRRPCEGPVIYQFRVSGTENLEAMVAKALELAPTAIDLNLGCPAPKIQQQASGAALWRDFPRLGEVLARLRKAYAGPLTVKCRLGDAAEDWRTPFRERLRLFEDSGVDALTVHPRFSDEKLKRRARWELFPWIAAQTRLPVVGNGDVCAPSDVAAHQDSFAPLAGLMLARSRHVAAHSLILCNWGAGGVLAAVLTAVKTHTPTGSPTRLKPGEIITYTVTLTNSGSVPGTSAVVTDPLPTGLTYVPNSIKVGPNSNWPFWLTRMGAPAP